MAIRLRIPLAALALSWGSAAAHAWGVEGHRALAMEASSLLTPAARAQVVRILDNDNLAAVSTWMDELREAHFHAGPLGHDSEALRFDHDFPHNGEWHYVDFPLGSRAYALDSDYARPDDVVHMIEAAVSVLEGGGDARITRKEALRMLVHFVGDLHQPLHVANGYFRTPPDGPVVLVSDPSDAEGLLDDRGGNADFFGPGKWDELHAYWDSDLVTKVGGGSAPRVIAGLLEADAARDGAGWASAGDYHHWAEAWASESIAAARTAYEGIVFGTATTTERGGIGKISVTLPKDYDQAAVPLARERLAKAGFHLAELLNALRWAD
jgi:hypothetical protein